MGVHSAWPIRIWVAAPITVALAKREEVPAGQKDHAEQVYLRAQGLNPSSWGSNWASVGPRGPFWAQSSEQTRFSCSSWTDVRIPTRHCRTSFLRSASLICSSRADSVVFGVPQGLPAAILHWGPGQGRENWAKEWRWPNFEMSDQGQRQTRHAEQVYLRAQGLNPSSSGSSLHLAWPIRVWVVGTLIGPWSGAGPDWRCPTRGKQATLSKFT